VNGQGEERGRGGAPAPRVAYPTSKKSVPLFPTALFFGSGRGGSNSRTDSQLNKHRVCKQ